MTIEKTLQRVCSCRDLNLNGNKVSKISYSSELIKDANFEYEEEWDIRGIPELLNELDADIEKSLKNIQTSKYDGIKIAINNKQDILKALQPKQFAREKGLKNLNCYKSATSLKLAKNKFSFEKNSTSSTFTGFSKGGHLISNSTNSISLCSTTLSEDIGQRYKATKNLEELGCTVSMTSQAGNSGNTGNNISGTGINITCGQSIPGSNSNNKPNNKMSIDHQATLDKGLKMKIKRTKPGTKTSEAKHEIVKATEQQQNGLLGSGNIVCSTSQESTTCLMPNQSTSSNQNSNVTLGISNLPSNSNLTGSKKMLGGGNNQINVSSTSGNLSLNNTGSTASNVSQGISQVNKRGSSGHRRDKTKEKSSYSNRTVIEKNSSAITEKESAERSLCQCSTAEGNISNCSNSSCIRKTENNTLTQRLPPKNTCSNTSVVPPGVFTPSSDTSTSGVVSNLLAVTSVMSTPVCTQTMSSGVNANSPGPPSKENSNSGANVKISSHIAAQLAAAAASNSSTNASPISSPPIPNAELMLSSSSVQSQTVKLLSPSKTSAAVNYTNSTALTHQTTSSASSTRETENSINRSTLQNENSESPPPKRIKQSDNNSISSVRKEMVDICIGTSVGTITEPDCLGPCEPGTSVTLEGIVWHETEGGVLVVNVTWRGKTYVGTLLDCTRHDWAPPRFCDSPTEDLDARTSKGRGKRSRGTITPDLSNFTETRSSIYFSHSHVHSKLRNGSTKGGRATSRTTNMPPAERVYSGSSLSSGNNGSTPSSSPTAFLPPRAEKRKSKDGSPPPANFENEVLNSGSLNASNTPISSSVIGSFTNQPQSLINPVTGLNVQISTKKTKTSSPCAISPVLLECPENDCSKKYKHVNGLRYHQSHAHGNTSLLDDDSMAETEDHVRAQPSPLSSTPTRCLTPNPPDSIPNNQIILSQPQKISEKCTRNKVNDDIAQQLEISEKNFSSETVSSISCENILTSTVSSSTTPTVPCASEDISSEAINNEPQKRFYGLVENDNISIDTVLSLESNNHVILQSSTGKSGVVPFEQEESKNNNGSCFLGKKSTNEILLQSESFESDSTKKCTDGHQDSNIITYCADPLEETVHLNLNQQNIVTNKSSPEISIVAKPKKERKSPPINDYDAVKVNSCNTSSREDVQSPAYSDISDDSTPINEPDHIAKVDVSKNADISKKTEDIGLSASTTCPSSHTNISSTLSSYGVYQFYQQQQYMVQHGSEQEQSTNITLNTNIGSTNISQSLTEQQALSELSSKKGSPLDLISKANLNQPLSNQLCQESNRDSTRTICATGSQSNSELSNVSSTGSGALNSTTPSKPVSHFYAFNYMPSNYPFNIDQNFGSAGSITTSEDNTKHNRLSRIASPNDQSQQQQNPVLYKEDRLKEERPTETVKSTNFQISSKQLLKSDPMTKAECIKQESPFTPLSQIPQHMQIQSKDHQGMGVYTNLYQRHPLALPSQQLSREEELGRYYIFSDQQRRQNSSSHNAMNQQIQNTSSQQCKDELATSQQHVLHSQQQIKNKGSTPLNTSKSINSSNTSKESPKHKQEEELKIIKQEGQKPTMETQGPPPPPTSQYFLHPSYITSTPFGFDPSHPMYRNVLMPATSPYNTPPYHLPMSRYHAPEDLSRNTGTKALDALHHAASQYYTTHKIHELSERALKSPNNSNSSNVPGAIKISGSSSNTGTTQHPNIGHHGVQNQSSSVTQLPHNIVSQTIGIKTKQDVASQKALGIGPGVVGTPNEPQKIQTINLSAASNCTPGNSISNTGNNINGGNTSDSRSPPPQRHVHTHHHTHVGLGYPMYPAPYGAAVLASQQAAAVAVINPFPPGPNK